MHSNRSVVVRSDTAFKVMLGPSTDTLNYSHAQIKACASYSSRCLTSTRDLYSRIIHHHFEIEACVVSGMASLTV